jgi:hypothetical protein
MEIKRMDPNAQNYSEDEIMRALYLEKQDKIRQERSSQPAGFIQGLAQSMAKTPIQISKAVSSLPPAFNSIITSDEVKKKKLADEAYRRAYGTSDAGYFGQVEAADYNDKLGAVGKGIEVGSYLVGGGSIANAGKQGVKQGLQTGLLQGVKSGAGQGLLGGFALGLQDENRSVGSVAGSTLLGGAGGAVTGGILAGSANGISKIPVIANKNSTAAGKILNSIIRPSVKDFSYGKNPGEAVAKAGITFNSLEDGVQKISTARQETGKKIVEALSNPKYSAKVQNYSDAFNAIDYTITKLQKESPRTNAVTITRLQNLQDDILQVTRDESGNIINQRSLQLNPSEAFTLKQNVADLTKYTGNPSDDKTTNQALQGVYRSIKDKIGQVVPEVRPLNEQYGGLTTAEKAIRHTNELSQKNNLLSFGDYNAGGIGALIALAGGHSAAAFGNALGLILVKKATQSPFVKTRIAKALSNLSSKEATSVINQSPTIRHGFIKAFGVNAVNKWLNEESTEKPQVD